MSVYFLCALGKGKISQIFEKKQLNVLVEKVLQPQVMIQKKRMCSSRSFNLLSPLFNTRASFIIHLQYATRGKLDA